MLLWLLFAVMTAATLAAVLRPLARPPQPSEGAAAGSVAVYRDQLVEIDAEAARGLIDPAEAEAARLEVARRLLGAADGAATPAAVTPARGRGNAVTLAVAGIVPLATLALYLAFGTPGLPGQPHAARIQRQHLQNAQIADLVAKVEARLRDAPDDGKGWDVIGPVYLKLGRFADAATAFQNAARLLGESPARLAGFAEARVFAADGIVGEDARKAYERLLALDPSRFEARFWLALAKEQDGQLSAAKADYEALLAAAPAEAPWRAAVEARVQGIAAKLAAPDGAAGGPTKEQIAAAEALSPAERKRMIEGMVDGLAQKLRADGRDLAGWIKLVRAYSVLERKDAARAALVDARKALADDKAALSQLTELATALGLGS